MRSRPPTSARLGVDTGGTFTDFALVDPDRGGDEVYFEKVPSTPTAPERALLDGLARLERATEQATARAGSAELVHGTTVALNALLTAQFARTALVTNEGFRDLLEIGRQDRPELYALHPVKPPAIVPRELRFEIAQRSWPRADDATVLESVRSPSRAELRRLLARLRAANVDSIAVCLLHSYADPRIEESVARALEPLGVPITTSSGLLREHREFERFSTAAVNAALVPVAVTYLQRLSAACARGRLELMQSNGGTLPAERAAIEPVRVLLSGPAGGVVGAARAAREAGFERMVGLDMGGTSTDVAFQSLARASHAARTGPIYVAGHPIAVPSLDIHTIGCGGGSLLHVDAGGVLRVGPESAGADPGPVCYGVGERATITDAHVLLGHVASGAFLAGRLELHVDAVERAFERLGAKLGLKPVAAAQAALDVANSAMRRALATMTMQRGEDPRATPLVAFGGAGGLHAADLAASLGQPCALVPRGPGVLSALGMATADAIRERSASVLAPLARISAAERRRKLAQLAHEARAELIEIGHRARDIEIEAALDLRYSGQSFEIRLPDSSDPARDFHARHAALYGYELREREIELVHVRVRAIVRRPARSLAPVRARAMDRSAILGRRRAVFATRQAGTRAVECPVIDRARLRAGEHFDGPALVEEFSGTTVVPPGWRARVAVGSHLVLERV
jgi:N-methylhydantoinase A